MYERGFFDFFHTFLSSATMMTRRKKKRYRCPAALSTKHRASSVFIKASAQMCYLMFKFWLRHIVCVYFKIGFEENLLLNTASGYCKTRVSPNLIKFLIRLLLCLINFLKISSFFCANRLKQISLMSAHQTYNEILHIIVFLHAFLTASEFF